MALLWQRTRKSVGNTADEVADLIERFLTDRLKYPWEWDDFISSSIPDARLDTIRAQSAALPQRFPSAISTEYCGPEGFEVLKDLVRQLRAKSQNSM